MKPKILSAQKGFTLIELIVAVVIVSVLASLAVPIFNDPDKANRAAADSIAYEPESAFLQWKSTDNKFWENRITADEYKEWK